MLVNYSLSGIVQLSKHLSSSYCIQCTVGGSISVLVNKLTTLGIRLVCILTSIHSLCDLGKVITSLVPVAFSVK